MAHNDRMRHIADPYLTQRLRAIQRIAYGVNIASGARSAAQEVRDIMGMGSGAGYAGLEGRSEMHDTEREDADDDMGYSDRDLMPDTNAPVNPAVQAFQDSGHGFSVKKGKEGQ